MKLNFKIKKVLSIPDKRKITRYLRSPDLGPRILFFSGGSALKKFSQQIIQYSHNTIHLITPFDDGGSSAVIREKFNMPAVGDFRNRLMALADTNLNGNPEVVKLFLYRFSKSLDQKNLLEELKSMMVGLHPLVTAIPNPLRKIIRNHLNYFFEKMPESFDLKGANIGNLIIVGGYLNNGYHLDPVLFLFSKLIECRGTVRPIVSSNLYLISELNNGDYIFGQKELSNKTAYPSNSSIKNLYLSKQPDILVPKTVEMREKVASLIRLADLIVFPIGSFFSSLLANLLPKGVGTAIVANPCPKVYVPNSTHDTEQTGLSLFDQVNFIISKIQDDLTTEVNAPEIINYILIDSRGDYCPPEELKKIKALGIDIIDYPILNLENNLIQENQLADVLLSLT